MKPHGDGDGLEAAPANASYAPDLQPPTPPIGARATMSASGGAAEAAPEAPPAHDSHQLEADDDLDALIQGTAHV